MIRVLFVDDERLLLDLSKEFLEQQEEDFQVDTAISAEEALDRLSEREYDVVVSDYKMPGMDGLEFLGELRNQGSKIPFIMFTGRGREEVAIEAFKRGADGYVMKGGDPESQYAELRQQIRLAVRYRQAEEALRGSEERYRILVELAHDGIMRTEGRERIITFANRRMAEMLGYTVEELVGKRYMGLVHPDEKEEALQNIKSDLASGKPATYMRRLVKKDGSAVHTIVSASLVNPGNQTELSPGILIVADITEQKEMEEALRGSEGRFRGIAERSLDIMYTLDLDGRISYVSPATERMLGYKPEEMVGTLIQNYVPKSDIPKVTQVLAEALIHDSLKSLEFNVLKKDGSTAPVEVNSSSILKDGKIVGFQGIVRDITERKKMEEELRESGEKYRQLVELAQEGIMMMNPSYEITFANPCMAEILGRKPGELVGSSYLSLVPPEDRESVHENARKMREGKTPLQHERALLRADGERITLLVSGTPLFDSKGTYIGELGVFTNITRRKQIEEALRQTEQRLLSIVENLHDPLAIVGEDRGIELVNRQVERYGYKPEEMIGERFDRFLTPESLKVVAERYEKRRRGEPVPSVYEVQFYTKNREVREMEVSASLISMGEGKTKTIAALRDITERKRLEDRERYLHSLLRHDLANKFQGAYGYLELLKRTTLQGKQEEYVEDLQESLQDAMEFIDKIRSLRTIDETKERVDVDLDLAIRDAIEDVSDHAKEHGIAIDYKGIPAALVTCSPLLKNAFTNLIDNSIRHAECSKITITVRELKDRYHVIVKDDGKGIPDKVKERLFEGGVKGPGSTGSGLGLHLVKLIIEASKGTTQLKDSKKGTRFDIYLAKAGAHKQ